MIERHRIGGDAKNRPGHNQRRYEHGRNTHTKALEVKTVLAGGIVRRQALITVRPAVTFSPAGRERSACSRAYGYGASMGAWVTDFLAGWAGEHGRVIHSVANYRGPALSGDITVQTAEVVSKFVVAH
jgi:hypothetical protein